jgi:carbonic anhydrase
MTHFSDSRIKQALSELAPSAKDEIEAAKFGEIAGSIEDSVREDVAMLKASPWIKDSTQIVGLKYDIETGLLSEVDGGKSEL